MRVAAIVVALVGLVAPGAVLAQEAGTYPGGTGATATGPAGGGATAILEERTGLLDLGLSRLDLRLVSADGRSLEIRFSGSIDSTWYGLGGQPSGMVTDTDPFLDVRTQVFADIFVGDLLTGLIEFRADRGHAPSDHEMLPRINQGFARWTAPGLGESASVHVQAGIFATPFGNFVRRHDAVQNPLIRRPLPYDHRTSIQPDYMDQTFDNFAPADVNFISWRDRREGDFRGEPLIWQEVYAGGAMLFGSVGPARAGIEYAVAVMNSALGSTAYVWSEWPRRSEAWTVHARIGARPTFGTRVGVSYSYGAWLPPDAERVLTRDYTDFEQQAFGLDLEHTVGHLDTFAEVIYTTWENPLGTPATGFHSVPVSSLGAYVEAKFTLAMLDPQLFVATRLGYIWNDEIRSGTWAWRKWDRDQIRIELGAGYRLGPDLLVKFAYEWNHTQAHRDPGDNAWLAQAVVSF